MLQGGAAGEWRTMSMVGEEEPRTPYLRTGLRQVVLGSDWGTGDTLILCAANKQGLRLYFDVLNNIKHVGKRLRLANARLLI